MRRRRLLKWAGVTGLLGLGALAARYWPEEGIRNPCPSARLPPSLRAHELVQAAWEGLHPDQVWDCHVHLIGNGDSGQGAWINPRMRSPWHPLEYAQYRAYLNASCVDPAEEQVDNGYISELLRLQADLVTGPRLMLLAFDYHHDAEGRRSPETSPFHIPDEYAEAVARHHPDCCEWIASIHPYRKDAVDALSRAIAGGARAVKWLPSVMGIDPASPRCDPFYEAMAQAGLPLLSHAGTELAVRGGGRQTLGNPLRLRRPLEHGVRVIAAHCASMGSSVDLDRGRDGPRVDNFTLFQRMMDEPRYQGLLFGEISAMTQINRMGRPLRTVLARDDWHHRLVNGSDYPLPGVMPLISLQALVDLGYLTTTEAQVLSRIRRYNPLLFDFVCKRSLKRNGARFGERVFMTRPVFRRGHADVI